MLLTLIVLCSLLGEALSVVCTGQAPGAPCKCVASDPATCSGAVVGTVQPTPAPSPVCRNALNQNLCDDTGVGLPGSSPSFCCVSPPTPGPTPCDGTTAATAKITAVTKTPGPLKCKGFKNGLLRIDTITTVPAGGTPTTPVGGPFTVTFTGGTAQALGALPSSVPGLKAGTNNFVVTNAGGCTFASSAIGVDGIAILTDPTITTFNPNCNGGQGRIEITPPTGGTPPYQYSINNGGSFSTNPVFDGLAAGSYTIVVKDSEDCATPTNSFSRTITAPAVVTVSISSQTPGACLADNATVVLNTAAGGTGPYQYSLQPTALPPLFQTSTTFNNVVPGAYSAVATDSKGCVSGPVAITVNGGVDIPAPATTVFTDNPLPCAGSFTTLTLTGLGAANPVKVDGNTVANVAGTATALVSGGVHSVALTVGACVKTFPANVSVNTPITSVTCNDNVANTIGDHCVDSQCIGGCVTSIALCGAGFNFGLRVEASGGFTNLLCAKVVLKTGGRVATFSDWSFQGDGGPPQQRIPQAYLNQFVGDYYFTKSGNKKLFSGLGGPNAAAGSTIEVRSSPDCFIRFDPISKKRAVVTDVVTLGGTPITSVSGNPYI